MNKYFEIAKEMARWQKAFVNVSQYDAKTARELFNKAMVDSGFARKSKTVDIIDEISDELHKIR